jgi:hypothetical protein
MRQRAAEALGELSSIFPLQAPAYLFAGLSPIVPIAGSARFETCLIVVTVAKIRTMQNMPAKADKIKRGSITRSSSIAP